MKTATLLKVWVVLILGWLFLLGPGNMELYETWRRTGGYREAFFLLMAVRLVVFSLALALILHVFYRRGVAQRAALGEIDATVTHTVPGLSQLVGALGLTFLVSQFPMPTVGGLVIGLLLTAGGGALLRRDTLRIEPGQKLVRISHLFGHPLRTTELVLPHTGRIRLKGAYRRGIEVNVGDLTVASGLDHETALRLAQILELRLGRTIDDEIARALAEGPRLGVRLHEGLSRLLWIGFLVVLVAVPIVWFIPGGRPVLCGFATSYLLLDDAPYVPYVEDACGRRPGEELSPGR